MPRTQVRCRGGRALSPPPSLNLPSRLCKSLYLNSTKMYISVRVSIVSDAAALVALFPATFLVSNPNPSPVWVRDYYLPSLLLLAELGETQLQESQVVSCVHGCGTMCRNHFWALSSLFLVSIPSCCCSLRSPTSVSLLWRASGSSWERCMTVIVCEVMWGHVRSQIHCWCP